MMSYAKTSAWTNNVSSSSRLQLRRFSFAGRSAELLPCRGHRHASGIDSIASIFRLGSVDDDFISQFHGGSRPSTILKAMRRAHLESPVGHGSVGVLHIDVEPDVGIRPFNLCDITSHRYNFGRVVLCCKGMMCHCRWR